MIEIAILPMEIVSAITRLFHIIGPTAAPEPRSVPCASTAW